MRASENVPDHERTRPWGVLLKVQLSADAEPAQEGALDQLLSALPGPHKKLTGAGRDLTVAWWVDAPDAAAAIVVAARRLRAEAASLGLADLVVVRSHAASIEGRAPALAADGRAAEANVWAVDIKAGMPQGGMPVGPDIRDRLRAVLPYPDAGVTLHGDKEKFLLDDGTGLTIRIWISGKTLEAALLAARDDVTSALAQIGLDAWTLIRVKAWDPRALQGDTFPGALDHEPMPTGEYR
jgi:hypothetical protein